jgi:serine/threonine protein kinase
MVMGTPQYLSPEQALGKTIDTRSDLYATGCLLYELLTRRPPFTGETPLSVVYQHVQDNPVLPSEVSDFAPPELDGLVMRALAKDPDDRFQTAEEMRGLTQYALQMLHEQGSHTGGLWNTGPTAHHGGSTPAMGVPGAGAHPHPSHSDTSQMGAPMLGGPRDDDGGFDGGPRRGRGRNGGGGKGVRYALVAFLAVIAIAGGIFFALQAQKGGDNKNDKPDPSTSETKDHKSSKDPSATPTEDDDQPGASEGTGDITPSSEPSESFPSETQPSETSPSKTDDDPSETGGSNDAGGQDGGGGSKPTKSQPPPTDGNDGGDGGSGSNTGESAGANEGGDTAGTEE